MCVDNQITECNKYIPGLDTLKAFGLWLMVLGHANLTDDNIKVAIFSFHMPLFFVISGFLFKFISTKDQIKKSCRGVLVPYLIVNLICLALLLVIAVKNARLSGSYLWAHVAPVVLGLGYDSMSYVPVCTPMWFFYVMFFLQIVTNIVGPAKRNQAFFVAASLATCLLLKMNSVDTIIPVDSLLMAVPFFYWGLWLKNTIKSVNIKSSQLRIVIVLLLIVLGIVIGLYNGRVDMNTFIFGKDMFLFYSSALLTCTALLYGSIRLRGGRFFRLISIGSPIIVGFNLMTTMLVKWGIHQLIPNLQWNNLIGVAASVFSFSVLMVGVIIVQRHFPVILGFRK